MERTEHINHNRHNKGMQCCELLFHRSEMVAAFCARIDSATLEKFWIWGAGEGETGLIILFSRLATPFTWFQLHIDPEVTATQWHQVSPDNPSTHLYNSSGHWTFAAAFHSVFWSFSITQFLANPHSCPYCLCPSCDPSFFLHMHF